MTEKPEVQQSAPKSGKRATSKGGKAKGSRPKNSQAAKRERDEKKSGGRPPWQPSIEDRIAVEQMKFVGDSEALIARALKVDVDTLRKHCAYELANGYANQRRKILAKLFEAADSGNGAALKRLDEMGRVGGAAQKIGERGSKPADEKVPAAPKLGKKEERQIAAANVNGKFAPPEPPKLVVDNSAAVGGK